MTARVRRILLTLAASSGLIAATTATAHAGLALGNHCEAELRQTQPRQP